MGQGQSQSGPAGFVALWAALPEEARERIGALAAKDSDALLKPNPATPPATPKLLVRLRHTCSRITCRVRARAKCAGAHT